MGKRKTSNTNYSVVADASESQIRRTHAEIADQSGELPELDLHGQTGQEASLNVYSYVTRMAASGESCCRIVHDKGTGVLQQVVIKEIKELMEQGIVETHFPSQKYPGAAEVIIFQV